ncbi:MAG: methyl-accepting chemotaxis protein [Alphaproteobacteria bacterium]|nr:methyl-accepting chemotaxis protein [Alphaproteobacteria bacterium]
MPTKPPSSSRLLHSLSFRLQLTTIVLSLVGVSFGVRGYIHNYDLLGAEKSMSLFYDLEWQIAIALIFNIGAAYIIYQIATKPVRVLGEVMRALTEGDTAIEVPYTKQGTEVGSMARKVAIFKQNAIDKKHLEEQQSRSAAESQEEKKRTMQDLAKNFEGTILSVVEIVASAAGDMQANAESLVAMAGKTSQQSGTVATATEQTISSVQTVAAAVDELSQAIGQINGQVAESAKINSEAVAEVRNADTTISTLSEAAMQIGDVVKLIQEIAGQTNLLALNATIEAARAGEAGKGFAVVASEVKNLATQTASATEEIASKIATIQSVSANSVTAIRGIGRTIDRTSEIASTISTAIVQQTAAAQKISANVQQASLGTDKISVSIADVTKDAVDSLAASEEVVQDSHKLFQQSERLQSEIKSFLDKIRHG